MSVKPSLLAAAIAALLAPAAHAQAPQASERAPTVLDTLIVTGTRITDRTVAESQSPIDIITAESLQATGTGELATALARALPSLNFPRPALTDGTSGVRPAQLRGLAPDQVLILVNGKRRHLSGLLNINGSMGRGSSAVDLNAIPVSAVERVEVLRDGASAQYGSDAIAGVVNIVLKGASEGGSLAVDHGRHAEGDGARYQLSGDAGVGFGDGRGRLHLAGQISQQDPTNRSGPYQGSAPHTGNFPGVGEAAFIIGDPKAQTTAVSANAGFQFSDAVSGYATAAASNRDVTSFAFYRSRNHSGQGALLAQLYPEGYVPQINQYLKDRSLVAGVRGSTDGGFGWDVSYNHGYNRIDFHTRNTVNYSLGVDSPSSFYDGALEYTHNILNADFTQTLDWGLAYPVTLSFGGEYREEKWNQSPGEPGSYENGGAQGFPGFTPVNAVHAKRDNWAAYAGLEGDFTERLSAGIAARYEDYSDFGSETSGKLSARYAFNDAVALRGTVSTGFRAPSLAQQGYQAVSSIIDAGVFTERGTFPASSAAAQALGAQPLQAETSQSYSLGLVIQPGDRLYLTIDAYRIDIDDRIVYSSNIASTAAARALLTGLGLSPVDRFAYFTNALDTTTEGVDLVATYSVPLAASALALTAGYSYNQTEITRRSDSPAVFADLGITTALIGRDELGRIEESFPEDKGILGASWTGERWSLGVNATRYGGFTVRNASGAARDQAYGDQWVVDVSASFRPDARWTLTLGADNVTDSYPDRQVNELNSTYGVFPYSNYSPAGFNGAYVYGRIAYRW
ncbi:TonB-dependent receptor plug domain-containing protein [Pseudoxanthomonas koreensis]|uniref:TonB-dependent receptor plug domain-containing protein n=1 Tax=Pseudoxanthomonas koreensis TaxID=266061 RepID=UPI0035A57DEF